MLKKIFGTFGTRLLCVLISFGLVIVNTNYFHAEGVGTIGLFVLGISILQIFTSVLGSDSIVYTLPRYDHFQIIFIAYLSSIIINLIGSGIMFIFKLIPMEYFGLFIFSTICVSFYSINMQILLSKKKIALYNICSLMQIVMLAIWLCYFIFIRNHQQVSSYFIAYSLSYLIITIISIIPAIKGTQYKGFSGICDLLKQLAKYGITIQLANLAQMLNYRLNYYIIEFCSGRKALGIYDLGTKLSESIWILPKSISTIQYTHISNCHNDKQYAKKITLAFTKLSIYFALIAIIVLLCLPKEFFAFIFGPEFIEVKPVLYVLGIGIFIFSANVILAHYFSGLGKFKINTIASIIGLIVTAVLGFASIPLLKSLPYLQALTLVGIITSISYTISCVYTFICFKKDANVTLKDFLLQKEDFSLLQVEIKKTFNRNEEKR